MAKKEKSEIERNYLSYSDSFPKKIADNVKKAREEKALFESYQRVAALNSLKVDIIKEAISAEAAAFFAEAHNDALLSHTYAAYGAWRTALQSLRAFAENTLSAIYYADHPIEYRKWEGGRFKISPRELRDYCLDHPAVVLLKKEIPIEKELNEEYATLSKAVHSSSSMFRMTGSDGKTNIGAYSLPELGKWSTREKHVLNACITIVVAVLNNYLDGAKMVHTRKALSLVVSKNNKLALRKVFNINIPD